MTMDTKKVRTALETLARAEDERAAAMANAARLDKLAVDAEAEAARLLAEGDPDDQAAVAAVSNCRTRASMAVRRAEAERDRAAALGPDIRERHGIARGLLIDLAVLGQAAARQRARDALAKVPIFEGDSDAVDFAADSVPMVQRADEVFRLATFNSEMPRADMERALETLSVR
jgi:hypothetical protein